MNFTTHSGRNSGRATPSLRCTPNAYCANQENPAGNHLSQARSCSNKPSQFNPVPAEVNDLDLITFFFAYHDVSFMEVDRAVMNRKMFQALKPGGHLVIADHSAKAGEGTTVGKSLHRIEEAALRKEIEAAGFVLVASGDFLRNPEDTRDVPVNKSPVRIDEFVLKFQKPAK